jgi:hypothetical protein
MTKEASPVGLCAIELKRRNNYCSFSYWQGKLQMFSFAIKHLLLIISNLITVYFYSQRPYTRINIFSLDMSLLTNTIHLTQR